MFGIKDSKEKPAYSLLSQGQTSSALQSYPIRLKGTPFMTFPQSLRRWLPSLSLTTILPIITKLSVENIKYLRNKNVENIEVLLNFSNMFIEREYKNVCI